jgi:hypothetical protein
MTPARLSVEDQPVIPPPSSVTVDHERKPVLYLPNGKVLVRKAGF